MSGYTPTELLADAECAIVREVLYGIMPGDEIPEPEATE